MAVVKMKNRGIILSSLIYTLLIFFLLLLAAILLVLWNRQNAIDKIKDDANEIYNA